MYNNFFNSFLMAFVPYGIVPINELYAWSNNQKIHILFHKIAELVEASNGYDKLFEEIKGLLADFDDEMKRQLTELLEKMYEDGTLDELLSGIVTEYLENSFAPKTTSINLKRNFRIALPSNTYNTTDRSAISEEYYSYCQGGCVTRDWLAPYDKDSKYFIGAFVCSNPSGNKYNDNCDLRVYRFNERYNDYRLMRNKVLSCRHANAVAVDEENHLIYIATSTKYNGGSTSVNDNTLFKIDAATLDVIGVTLCNIDSNNKCSLVAVHNGEVYVGVDGSHIKIKKVKTFNNNGVAELEDFIDYELPYTRNFGGYTLAGTGLAITDNYVFVGQTSPNKIYRFNRLNNNILDWSYDLGNFGNNHMFPLGEVENISVVDNVLYVGTTQPSNNVLSYWDYTQIFSFDYVNNSISPSNVYHSNGNSYRVIYAGDVSNTESVTPLYREISNPNGLSSNPFPLVSEALMFANAQNIYNSIRIKIKTRNMVEYLVVLSNKRIIIDGEDYYSSHQTATELENRYVHIGGLWIYGSNITLSLVQIENRVPLNEAEQFSKYQIRSIGSKVDINSQTKFKVVSRGSDSQWLYSNRDNMNVGTMLSSSGSEIEFNSGNCTLYNTSINFHGHFDGSNTNVIN